jgi:predicted AlkP superfamily pyrophosphatase or phosphodiesterase
LVPSSIGLVYTRDLSFVRLLRPSSVLLLVLLIASCRGAPPVVTPAPPSSGAARGSGGINAPEHRDKPYVVLISVDGVRHDYLDRYSLPHFGRLMKEGTRAEGLIPVFPSKTFPNHYSIVTGLYAESHGLVANAFYDPARRDTYAMGKERTVRDGTWYRGEPIWVTAEKQGMVAGCYFWPGSEADIGGVRPTFFTHYDHGEPHYIRVDKLLEWLRLPDERRPHLLTTYFSDVDGEGHRNGPATPAVADAMRNVDRALGRLFAGIDALPIRDRVFVVLVSDHGMAPTSRERMLPFPSIDLAGITVVDGGTIANVHVTGDATRIASVREAISRQLSHGRAYLRAELPERFHYSKDPRAGDIVIVMEEEYLLLKPGEPPYGNRGNHGWDPEGPNMHGIFVISGPGVRAGATIPRFENVDIYPLLTEILGLRPAPNIEGEPGRLRQLVRLRAEPSP